MNNSQFKLTPEELKSVEHLKPQPIAPSKPERKMAILFTVLYALFGAPIILAIFGSFVVEAQLPVIIGVMAVALGVAVGLGFVAYRLGAKSDKKQNDAKIAEQEKRYQSQMDVYMRAVEGKVAEKKARLCSSVCEFCGGKLQTYETGVTRQDGSYRDGVSVYRDYSHSTPAFKVKESRVNYSTVRGTEVTYCDHCKYAIELDYEKFVASGGFPLTTYKQRRIMLRNGCTLQKQQVENGRLAEWLPDPNRK